MLKHCNGCNLDLSTFEFWLNQSRCKSCLTAYRKSKEPRSTYDPNVMYSFNFTRESYITKKICGHCKINKSLFAFSRQSAQKDGLNPWCRTCSRVSKKQWDKENAEHVSTYDKIHHAVNKERDSEVRKAWYIKNKEHENAYSKQYLKDNPEGNRDRGHKRRALKLTNGPVDDIKREIIFERDDWICQLCFRFVDRLAVWPEPDFATIDHIIPIAKGGTHTWGNVQTAHRYCNNVKRDKL